MNVLQIFNFKESEVRTLLINDEPYFVGKDVAGILGYSEPRKAVARHVDSEDGMKHPILTNGGTQEMTVINESGLYSLILSSKLPQAKEFKRWVTKKTDYEKAIKYLEQWRPDTNLAYEIKAQMHF